MGREISGGDANADEGDAAGGDVTDEKRRKLPPRLEPDDPEYHPFLDAVDSTLRLYDRDGQPITMRQWGELSRSMPRSDPGSYARIASDVLDDGHIWISTVWLGIDHGWRRDGPPIIFETMAFVRLTEDEMEERRQRWARLGFPPHEFPWEEIETQRYATEEQAREGHRRLVDSLRLRVDNLEEIDDGQ